MSIATVDAGSRPRITSVVPDASPSEAIAAAESSAIVRAGAFAAAGGGVAPIIDSPARVCGEAWGVGIPPDDPTW